jgi:hypothetical protein
MLSADRQLDQVRAAAVLLDLTARAASMVLDPRIVQTLFSSEQLTR